MTKSITTMRLKFLIPLLLLANAAFGQGVYRYKNLAITATCDKGSVTCDSDLFVFKDSLVQIGIQVNERTVCAIIVTNEYNKPIAVKWKRIGASNSDRDFYSFACSSFVDMGSESGEDKLYNGERRTYILNNWTDEMFSKKKKNQRGNAHVAIVADDKLIDYYFDLMANPIEK